MDSRLARAMDKAKEEQVHVNCNGHGCPGLNIADISRYGHVPAILQFSIPRIGVAEASVTVRPLLDHNAQYAKGYPTDGFGPEAGSAENCQKP